MGILASIADWIGDITASQASVAVSVVGAIASTIAIVYAKSGSDEARGANRAVNGNSPGMPRLWDLVYQHREDIHEIRKWQESFDDSPWRNGTEIATWVTQNEERAREMAKAMNNIRNDCPGCLEKVGELQEELATIKETLEQTTS